ncbi:hypothetical protein H632_c2605p0 [Helicosporidium sp. ATCC 50920]|nr:hypothetical protein H632_c2605p0 [Helicosporidium sp. ATCC 50920]|eukprot:KDD73037.1 hypothetical protein H632_c2605p0 [Helicosporidium sp. ATCC 50920]
MTRQRAGASRPKAPPVSDGAGSSSARKRSNEPGPSEEAKQPAQDVVELEKKREAVADELRHVEQQIFDLETKYLESASAYGNAIRGYQGFLGGVSVPQRKVAAKSEERLFSWSSVTGQAVPRH